MKGKCGLYIHIPFCSSKCLYCDFFSNADNNAEIDTYISNMIKAIKNYGEKYCRKVFDTIYIGGGTPSVVGTDNLAKIIRAAKRCFTIENAEITIEMNPRSAQQINFKSLYELGVNRISLGVQSAVDNELKLLGRMHNNNDVSTAVEMIRSNGIDNISLDLMVGIARQTEHSLKRSMDFCIALNPKHISAYILKVEENTPYHKLAPSLNLPDDDRQAELYKFMQGYLTSNGYEQYEISNFAKRGFESRHNTKYWNCDEYLGLGASAHSMMDGRRFYFPRSNEDFYNNKYVSDGEGATSEEYIMLRLRLREGLHFIEYEKLFNQALPQKCANVAKKYEKYGLTCVDNEKIILTEKGFLLSNSIIAEMLE